MSVGRVDMHTQMLRIASTVSRMTRLPPLQRLSGEERRRPPVCVGHMIVLGKALVESVSVCVPYVSTCISLSVRLLVCPSGLQLPSLYRPQVVGGRAPASERSRRARQNAASNSAVLGSTTLFQARGPTRALAPPRLRPGPQALRRHLARVNGASPGTCASVLGVTH